MKKTTIITILAAIQSCAAVSSRTGGFWDNFDDLQKAKIIR